MYKRQVLQTGYFEIIEAHDDLIFMRRFLDEKGYDVFGHQVTSPNEASVSYTHLDVYKRQMYKYMFYCF